MVLFTLVDANTLDLETFSLLQREAYVDVLKKIEFSNAYMNPEFYRWKFNPPLGSAKICLAKENDLLVASSGCIPLEICFKEQRIRGWQATDAACLARFRRKGYASTCSQKIQESLGNNEVLYVFPNQSSIRFIATAGFVNKGIITTWIKPAYFLKKRVSSNVITITRFDKTQDTLATRLASRNHVMVHRSSEYLNWRYVDHPIYHYNCFIYREGDEQQGFSVIRSVNALGRKIGLIMEFWGLTPSIQKALLRSMAEWAIQQHIRQMVLQDSTLSILRGLSMGFIEVPANFLPKKQYLMVYASHGSISEEVKNNKWWIQIGDWDGL